MDQSLKERLVGAAVLVVLAVIFVPMVLDGPDQPAATAPATVAAVPSGASTFRYDLAAPLPADGAAPTTTAPTATSATLPTATAAPIVASAAKPAAAPATKPTATVAPKAVVAEPKAAETKPAPKPEPAAASGWAAQVGSFSKQATADAVAADLKERGFKAFVMPHKDGKTTLYRVRVGPVATREAADALAKKIIAKTGQTARPVPHP
jgi:DedD protein